MRGSDGSNLPVRKSAVHRVARCHTLRHLLKNMKHARKQTGYLLLGSEPSFLQQVNRKHTVGNHPNSTETQFKIRILHQRCMTVIRTIVFILPLEITDGIYKW
jgi:hypothetical protein